MKEAKIKPLVSIDRNELKRLCTQVPETLATENLIEKQQKVFGPADLWQIRRTGRYRVQRRANNQVY